MNSTIQGSAFDIMKVAMVRTRQRFLDDGIWLEDVCFVNNLHDAMTLEVRLGNEEHVAKVASEIMESAYKLRVPLVAEPKFGYNNWLETK